MAKKENNAYCEACGFKIKKGLSDCPNCGLKLSLSSNSDSVSAKKNLDNLDNSEKRKQVNKEQHKKIFTEPNTFEIVLYILGVLILITYIFTVEQSIGNRLFAIILAISLFKFIYEIIFSYFPNLSKNSKVVIRIIIPLTILSLWSCLIPSETSSVENDKSMEFNEKKDKDNEKLEDINLSQSNNESKENNVNNNSTANKEIETNTNNNISKNNIKQDSKNTDSNEISSDYSDNSQKKEDNKIDKEEKKGNILLRFYGTDRKKYNDYWLNSGENFTIPNNNYSKEKVVNVTYHLYLDDIHYNDYKTYYSYTVYNASGWKLNNSSIYNNGQAITIHDGNWIFTPNFDEKIECAKVPTPTREGYIFNGWSATTGRKSGIDLDFCGSSNTTSKWYATWKSVN